MTLEEFIITEVDVKNEDSAFIGIAPKIRYGERESMVPFYQWLTQHSVFTVNELNTNGEVDAYIVNVKQLLNLDDEVSKEFLSKMNFLRNVQAEARYHFYNTETNYSETTYKCFIYTNLTDLYNKLEKKRQIYQAKLKSIETTKAELWKATHP